MVTLNSLWVDTLSKFSGERKTDPEKGVLYLKRDYNGTLLEDDPCFITVLSESKKTEEGFLSVFSAVTDLFSDSEAEKLEKNGYERIELTRVVAEIEKIYNNFTEDQLGSVVSSLTSLKETSLNDSEGDGNLVDSLVGKLNERLPKEEVVLEREDTEEAVEEGTSDQERVEKKSESKWFVTRWISIGCEKCKNAGIAIKNWAIEAFKGLKNLFCGKKSENRETEEIVMETEEPARKSPEIVVETEEPARKSPEIVVEPTVDNDPSKKFLDALEKQVRGMNTYYGPVLDAFKARALEVADFSVDSEKVSVTFEQSEVTLNVAGGAIIMGFPKTFEFTYKFNAKKTELTLEFLTDVKVVSELGKEKGLLNKFVVSKSHFKFFYKSGETSCYGGWTPKLLRIVCPAAVEYGCYWY